MPACRGIAIIRLSDKSVLAQRLSDEQPLDDDAVWVEAVDKCCELSGRSSDRLSYTNRAQDATMYAVAKKDKGIGAVSAMSTAVGQRVGYLCCDKTLDVFCDMFVERASSLSSETCKTFDGPLAKLVEQFGDDSVVDVRVAKVKRTVDEVRDMAIENVERVIERGERIESMVEQTEQLQDNARGFHSQSTALRRQMWWNGVRTKLAIGGIVVGFLFVVYVIFCGGISCSDDKK
eukprot:CAMPEP_0174842742 /NCGR_PEP_ID=MMETSP1114-20130205/10096_1 /TAXON_ID=312471 /ORGANISM="Neobodo designis, Strain CCAP 1951/1" /LENGTH=232 /DNA_ID=CAMNT_0016076951 /DNA_START=32 /DNA_END=730 /DNA_ORIENTATION=-